MNQSEISNGNHIVVTEDKAVFMDVSDVSELLGVSKSKAYKIIRDLNNELTSNGFITIGGKVIRRYLYERMDIK